MGRKYASTEIFSAQPDKMGAHVVAAFDANQFILLNRDQDSSGTTRNKFRGVSRSGEKLSVHVDLAGTGSSVTVDSKLTFDLFDRGRNQRNVEAILNSLRIRLL